MVDDVSYILAHLKMKLTQLGHEVTATDSPVRALSYFERGQQFDLVLCDLMMPEMDGVDLFDKTIQIFGPDQCPDFILITACQDQSLLEKAATRPFLKILSKPVKVPELEQLFKNIEESNNSESHTDNAALIVSPDQGIQIAMTRLLKQFTPNILFANNGADGLQKFKKILNRIQLLVLDAYLSDEKSFEFFKNCYKYLPVSDQGKQPMPYTILVYSEAKASQFSSQILTEATQVGINEIVTMPVKVGMMEQLLEPVFDKKSGNSNQNKAILLVDDIAYNLVHWEKMAKAIGDIEVFTAKSGSEALKLVQNKPSISGIITDFNLTDMNGAELFKQVQSHSNKLPVALVTSCSDSKQLEEAVSRAFTGIYKKPLKANQFQEIINDFLKKE